MEAIVTAEYNILGNDEIATKIWCKRITAVDMSVRNGYALIGDWSRGFDLLSGQLSDDVYERRISFGNLHYKYVYVIGISLGLIPADKQDQYPVTRVAFLLDPSDFLRENNEHVKKYQNFEVSLIFDQAGMSPEDVEIPWHVIDFDTFGTSDNPFWQAAVVIDNTGRAPRGVSDQYSQSSREWKPTIPVKFGGVTVDLPIIEQIKAETTLAYGVGEFVEATTKPVDYDRNGKVRYKGKTYRLPDGWTESRRIKGLIFVRHPKGHETMLHELIEVEKLNNELYALIDDQAKALEELAAIYRIVGAPGRSLREDREKRVKDKKAK